jgi:HEAT repeat protein
MRRSALGLFAVVILGCGGPGRVEYSVPSLVKALKDKDPDMRYWAVQSLGHLGHMAKPAVPALIEALHDENEMVRMGAAYALAELGPDATDAVPTLQSALRDPEKQVRDAATYALKRLKRKK